MKYRISQHAEEELERRNIPRNLFDQVLNSADQEYESEPGISVKQSKFPSQSGNQEFLIRVFIGHNTNPATVVTVYKTTQIKKYWRESK